MKFSNIGDGPEIDAVDFTLNFDNTKTWTLKFEDVRAEI